MISGNSIVKLDGMSYKCSSPMVAEGLIDSNVNEFTTYSFSVLWHEKEHVIAITIAMQGS